MNSAFTICSRVFLTSTQTTPQLIYHRFCDTTLKNWEIIDSWLYTKCAWRSQHSKPKTNNRPLTKVLRLNIRVSGPTRNPIDRNFDFYNRSFRYNINCTEQWWRIPYKTSSTKLFMAAYQLYILKTLYTTR